jgi:hypothetical protein
MDSRSKTNSARSSPDIQNQAVRTRRRHARKQNSVCSRAMSRTGLAQLQTAAQKSVQSGIFAHNPLESDDLTLEL